MSVYINHLLNPETNITKLSSILAKTLKIGELFTVFKNGNLYTKNMNGDLQKVGQGITALKDFNFFTTGVVSDKYHFSFCQLKYIDTDLKLTTTYPFISIRNLRDTVFNSYLFEEDKYLQFNTEGKLTEGNPPFFTIQNLADVNISNLNNSVNNYVLTSLNQSSSTSKDPYNTNLIYSWVLRPEATKLTECSDVYIANPPYTNNVLRSRTPVEQRGIGLDVIPFQIAYDNTPALSTHLVANSHYRYNEIHDLAYFAFNTDSVVVELDVSKYNAFVLDGTNVKYIRIKFVNKDKIGCKTIGITLASFNAAIEFLDNITVENGVGLKLTGKRHMLSVIINNQSGQQTITLLQKATNMSKVEKE